MRRQPVSGFWIHQIGLVKGALRIRGTIGQIIVSHQGWTMRARFLSAQGADLSLLYSGLLFDPLHGAVLVEFVEDVKKQRRGGFRPD